MNEATKLKLVSRALKSLKRAFDGMEPDSYEDRVAALAIIVQRSDSRAAKVAFLDLMQPLLKARRIDPLVAANALVVAGVMTLPEMERLTCPTTH